MQLKSYAIVAAGLLTSTEQECNSKVQTHFHAVLHSMAMSCCAAYARTLYWLAGKSQQ